MALSPAYLAQAEKDAAAQLQQGAVRCPLLNGALLNATL